MERDIKFIRKRFDIAKAHAQETREKSANDMVFYFLSQYDEDFYKGVTTSYRGEFNILKKAGRQIMSDLAENPVQVDFEPEDLSRTDAAEVADGLYRADDMDNTSIEAYENGKQEAVVCGVGAWKLCAEYEYKRGESRHQVVKRYPIFEANAVVYWDPNAKLMDKSDAEYVFVLCSYSEEAYEQLVSDLTGEDVETINPNSFEDPDTGQFVWYMKSEQLVYVVEYYERVKEKTKLITMVDPFGNETTVRDYDLEDVIDDLLDEGYSVAAEKKIEEYRVWKYIASGADVLDSRRIPGEYIPIIPCYGEHAFVEGVEHWEGITRLAKDPSRLRNFAMSYLADIFSKSPKEKPIYWPEQIAGFEHLFSENGPDSQYQYALMNRKAPDGSDLPAGPVETIPAAQIPPATLALLDLTRQAVEDVANPGVPQDVADPEIMSGKAVLAIQARLDMQSAIYQQHFKHAKRRDGEVWASIAAEIYDAPRKTISVLPDGTRKETEVMSTVLDAQTGEYKTINDIYDVRFRVFSKIGPSYQSQRQQTVEQLGAIESTMDPMDPMRKAITLKRLQLMDGVDFDDIREYANKQLVLSGIKKPETDEEKQLLEQAQNQPKEPDANMMLAMAEMEKAKADQMREQREMAQGQVQLQLEQVKLEIEKYKAETARAIALQNARLIDAKIDNTDIDSISKSIDNQMKVADRAMPEVADV